MYIKNIYIFNRESTSKGRIHAYTITREVLGYHRIAASWKQNAVGSDSFRDDRVQREREKERGGPAGQLLPAHNPPAPGSSQAFLSLRNTDVGSHTHPRSHPEL